MDHITNYAPTRVRYPKGAPRQAIKTRLAPEALDRVREIARRDGTSVAAVIRCLVAAALDAGLDSKFSPAMNDE